LYRDAQIYKVWQTRRAWVGKGLVNLGEFGSGDCLHSGLISFVTNIDFVRVAAMGDILPDRILEIYRVLVATYLGMMILVCSDRSQLRGDRRKGWAARADPHWRG